mgnify:CR=1 FL=1
MSEQYDPSNILNSEGCVYVRYEVYAALQAENERLRKERDKLDFKESCEYKRREEWEKACIEARAEVERLRKAGDAMAEFIDFGDDNETMQTEWEAAALAKWLAAKGVQP